MTEVETLEGFDYWTLHAAYEPILLGQPAAGSALTYTVPGTIEIEVLSASFTYTASANVATRIPFLAFLDQSGVAVGSFAAPLNSQIKGDISFEKNLSGVVTTFATPSGFTSASDFGASSPSTM